MRISDWSSDVCSSDLLAAELTRLRRRVEEVERLEAERAEASAALQESEARLRDFADAASDWFWEMDAELRFSFMSERLREVTGVDPCSTLGKTRQEIGAGHTHAEKWETPRAQLSANRPAGKSVASGK